MKFVCPKCHRQLNITDGCARCDGGHSYDRARAGYYNLLLDNAGGTHGDNRDMVEARRVFLSRGYYKPLADRMAQLSLKYTEPCGCLLDAGCGEGYYTDAVERAILERDGESCVLAFDISRDAVKYAAKRNRRPSFAVASSYDIPLLDGAVDTVINVFSPMAVEETKRVLKSGGVFIFA